MSKQVPMTKRQNPLPGPESVTWLIRKYGAQEKITSYNDLEVYQPAYKACLSVSSKRFIIILNEHCALRHSVFAMPAYGRRCYKYRSR